MAGGEGDAATAALAAMEARLDADPGNLDHRFERACLLTMLGRTEEAREAYLEILAARPDHEGTLNNLGALLYETGFRSAARTLYRQAVAAHPGKPMGRVNLGNLLCAEGALDEARGQFEAALALDPAHPEAHRGLGQALESLGAAEDAWPHHAAAYAGREVQTLPYRGSQPPLRVLAPVSARGGNVPTRFILLDSEVRTTAIVAEFADPDMDLPPHDIVFNTIGDADLSGLALRNAAHILQRSDRPVLNRPAAVLATGRAALAERLRGTAGVRTPIMLDLPRQAFVAGEAGRAVEAAGLAYPVLLRALGFHTGQHFVRVADEAALAEAAASMPGQRLAVIEALDAKGQDGRFRKMRVMTIGGRLYPLHLAVSPDWKVHYFTAEMETNPAFRAEEAAFLRDMPAMLGGVAIRSLEKIAETIGLDYGGMDFALGRDGEVLLFEANATMVLNPPGPEPMWDYRRPAAAAALDAAKALLRRGSDRF
jgi:hypothetical protein